MPVRDTSIEAFRKLVADGTYENHVQAVTECQARFGPSTRLVIENRSGLSINVVCSAVNNAIHKKRWLIDKRVKLDCSANETDHKAWLVQSANYREDKTGSRHRLMWFKKVVDDQIGELFSMCEHHRNTIPIPSNVYLLQIGSGTSGRPTCYKCEKENG